MATRKTAAKAPAKTAAKKSAPAESPAESPAKSPAKSPIKTAAKSAAKAAAPKTPATHQQIAALAHKYFAERGHSHGSHVNDWLRAEKELNG